MLTAGYQLKVRTTSQTLDMVRTALDMSELVGPEFRSFDLFYRRKQKIWDGLAGMCLGETLSLPITNREGTAVLPLATATLTQSEPTFDSTIMGIPGGRGMVPLTGSELAERRDAVALDVTTLIGADEYILARNNRVDPRDPFARQCFAELVQSVLVAHDQRGSASDRPDGGWCGRCGWAMIRGRGNDRWSGRYGRSRRPAGERPAHGRVVHPQPPADLHIGLARPARRPHRPGRPLTHRTLVVRGHVLLTEPERRGHRLAGEPPRSAASPPPHATCQRRRARTRTTPSRQRSPRPGRRPGHTEAPPVRACRPESPRPP
jgi:hypothetical protein